jgi:hypothetical protein
MGSKKQTNKQAGENKKKRDFCNGARMPEHRQSFVTPKSISRNCWRAALAMATSVLELPGTAEGPMTKRWAFHLSKMSIRC